MIKFGVAVVRGPHEVVPMTRLKVEEASTALHVLLHSSKVHCSKVHCFVAFKVHLHKQGKREKKKKKTKKEKEGDSTYFVPSSAAASTSAPNRKLFTKKLIKEPHKIHQTPRKHIKRLFRFCFFLLVGLVYFPWVGGFWI